MSTASDSIVITFPVQFLFELGLSKLVEEKSKLPDSNFMSEKYLKGLKKKYFILNGFKELSRQIDEIINNPDNNIWYHRIGVKPNSEILYVYISVLNEIRWKAKVVEWQEGHEKEFQDGRVLSAKHWLVLCDFVKAPQLMPFKGCQGFRYTDKLF